MSQYDCFHSIYLMFPVSRSESQLRATTSTISHRCKITRLSFPSRHSTRIQSTRQLATAPSPSALIHWKRQASLRQAKEKQLPQQPLHITTSTHSFPQCQHNQGMPRRPPKKHFDTIEGYPRVSVRQIVKQLQSLDQNDPQKLIQSLRQDLANRKVQSRSQKKSIPVELETRKLEWEGRKIARPIPYTATKQEWRQSEGRKAQREQILRLSGWENEQVKVPLFSDEFDF